MLAIETASNGLSVRPMPNGRAHSSSGERAGLPINLEELDTGANKVLMFNPQENGPARAGVKGRRRDDLFDANKFFFSNVSNPTNGQSQAKMRHNRQNLSGSIGSDLLLSFDLLPELQPFSLPIVDSLSGKEILHTICNLTVDLNFRKLQRL